MLISGVLQAQIYSVNNPFIINYTKQQYQGGTENWDMASTSDGRVLVANNEGLLIYNGYEWERYQLPNKTIVRSVEFDSTSNRIYIGGQDELGYFFPDQRGCLQYQSIRNLLPAGIRSLEDVWDIQLHNKMLYFRSVNKIFTYDGATIRQLSLPLGRISFLRVVGNRVVYCDSDKGLYEIRKGVASAITGSTLLGNGRVSDMLSLPGGEWLVVTEKNGIFQYDGTSWKAFLSEKEHADAICNSAVLVGKNQLAVATVRKGILFFDLRGRLLYQIGREQGLQTNSIIRIGTDHSSNLWACTSNGIDKVLIRSPYSIMFPDLDLRGGVYAVKKFRDKLYVGTLNGLYYTTWLPDARGYRTARFTEVANSSGQVWGLDIVHDQLFMGHNEGSFLVEGDKSTRLTDRFNGTWRHIATADRNVLLAGTYGGIERFVRKENSWVHERHLNGFEESARILFPDGDGQLWVSHPYRGVYRLSLSPTADRITRIIQYDSTKGLGSSMDNYIAQLNQQVYVCGDKGIFVFDSEKGVFSVDTALTRLLGSSGKIRRLFQESGKNIWYVKENETGFLQIQNTPVSKSAVRIPTPFLKDKLIGGFENIYIPDEQENFICTDRGLILAEMGKLSPSLPITLRIEKIKSFGQQDSILYGGYGSLKELGRVTIPHFQNTLSFSLGSNSMDDTNPVMYRWKMDGRDTTWSDWQVRPVILLTNLKPGNYTFIAEASDNIGQTSGSVRFPFTILRPWYASWTALVGYAVCIILIFYIFSSYLNRKHEGEKTALKQEKEVSEARVQDLLNEKLQSEIDFKNKELALSTMHIVQKNETLTRLREELYSLTKSIGDAETRKSIRKVISILSDDQALESDWESFARHFDQVHTDFIRRLKESYPQLSPKDLKLCAYLRLNLSTKELAPLLNISVRGVEISRYRLRKKLNLHADINLNDFMMNY